MPPETENGKHGGGGKADFFYSLRLVLSSSYTRRRPPVGRGPITYPRDQLLLSVACVTSADSLNSKRKKRVPSVPTTKEPLSSVAATFFQNIPSYFR